MVFSNSIIIAGLGLVAVALLSRRNRSNSISKVQVQEAPDLSPFKIEAIDNTIKNLQKNISDSLLFAEKPANLIPQTLSNTVNKILSGQYAAPLEQFSIGIQNQVGIARFNEQAWADFKPVQEDIRYRLVPELESKISLLEAEKQQYL